MKSTQQVLPFATLIMLVSMLIPNIARADGHGDREWIASWGASPSDPAPQVSSQTIREHVRVSVGGNRIRLRLSNRFGTQSLVVGAVHVALQDSGAAIVPSTDRSVTFGGAKSITIPPGALAVSDPVHFAIDSLRELAISIYLPGDSGPLTVHALGVQTAYISPAGDFTASAALPIQSTSLSRYLLSDVEVSVADEADAVVTFGDSITDGYCSTVDANHRWPDFLAQRLHDSGRGEKVVTVVDQGISGNRLLHNVAGPSGLERFDRDVIAQSGVRWVTVLLGINDIGFVGLAFQPPGENAVTADEIIGAHKQLILRAHAAGLKIYGATLTPFEGTTFPGYYTPAKEPIREAVNRFIRNSGGYDAVIDFDRALRDPAHPTRMLAAYDCGDHLHPNDAGYNVMAQSVDLRLFGKE